MKKTINKVRYDTKQDAACSSTDLNFSQMEGSLEVLRRTKSQRYYIHSSWTLINGRRMQPGTMQGLALTRGSRSVRVVNQEQIKPISRLQALVFCLHNLNPSDLKIELRKLLQSPKVLKQVIASLE